MAKSSLASVNVTLLLSSMVVISSSILLLWVAYSNATVWNIPLGFMKKKKHLSPSLHFLLLEPFFFFSFSYSLYSEYINENNGLIFSLNSYDIQCGFPHHFIVQQAIVPWNMFISILNDNTISSENCNRKYILTKVNWNSERQTEFQITYDNSNIYDIETHMGFYGIFSSLHFYLFFFRVFLLLQVFHRAILVPLLAMVFFLFWFLFGLCYFNW